MTVKQLERPIRRYIGASTDTKPTTIISGGVATSEVPIGSTFYEYDTGVMYITYDGANWEIKAATSIPYHRPLFQRDTGTGAIAKTLAPGAAFRLLGVRCHFASAQTQDTFTITNDNGSVAAVYDDLLYSVAGSTGVTDVIQTFGVGFEFYADDEIDVAYTGTDGDVYGLTFIYELI